MWTGVIKAEQVIEIRTHPAIVQHKRQVVLQIPIRSRETEIRERKMARELQWRHVKVAVPRERGVLLDLHHQILDAFFISVERGNIGDVDVEWTKRGRKIGLRYFVAVVDAAVQVLKAADLQRKQFAPFLHYFVYFLLFGLCCRQPLLRKPRNSIVRFAIPRVVQLQGIDGDFLDAYFQQKQTQGLKIQIQPLQVQQRSVIGSLHIEQLD